MMPIVEPWAVTKTGHSISRCSMGCLLQIGVPIIGLALWNSDPKSKTVQ